MNAELDNFLNTCKSTQRFVVGQCTTELLDVIDARLKHRNLKYTIFGPQYTIVIY